MHAGRSGKGKVWETDDQRLKSRTLRMPVVADLEVGGGAVGGAEVEDDGEGGGHRLVHRLRVRVPAVEVPELVYRPPWAFLEEVRTWLW